MSDENKVQWTGKAYVVGELRREDGKYVLKSITVKSYRASKLTCADGRMWCDFGEVFRGQDFGEASAVAEASAQRWREWFGLEQRKLVTDCDIADALEKQAEGAVYSARTQIRRAAELIRTRSGEP